MKNENLGQADNVDLETLWKKRFFLLLTLVGLLTVLLSFGLVRGVVAYPLYVHDPEARGDAAYVMADGSAYWPRLRAASDLYHMKRVPRILILEELESTGFNFVKGQSESVSERAINYLAWHGVPEDVITIIPSETDPLLGSLSEAKSVAENVSGINKIVVVTSAPHTRRSLLSFRRTLPDDVDVTIFSASPPDEGAEIDAPIWIEYVKLVVYYFAA